MLYPRAATGTMGVIGNVFGGGNAAQVVGSTYVNIGTKTGENIEFESLTDDTSTIDINEKAKRVVGADIRGNIYGGGNQAEVTGDTNVTIGKKNE